VTAACPPIAGLCRAWQTVGGIDIEGCTFVDNFAFGDTVNRGTHLYFLGTGNSAGERAVAIHDTTFNEEDMRRTLDAIENSDLGKQWKPSGGFVAAAISLQRSDIILVNVTMDVPYHSLFQYPTTSGFIEIISTSITRSAVDLFRLLFPRLCP
jgi:hypothetical protein